MHLVVGSQDGRVLHSPELHDLAGPSPRRSLPGTPPTFRPDTTPPRPDPFDGGDFARGHSPDLRGDAAWGLAWNLGGGDWSMAGVGTLGGTIHLISGRNASWSLWLLPPAGRPPPLTCSPGPMSPHPATSRGAPGRPSPEGRLRSGISAVSGLNCQGGRRISFRLGAVSGPVSHHAPIPER